MCNKNIVFNDRSIIHYIILIILSTTAFTMGQNEWVQLHDDPEFTISGVAQFNNGYIVVHDNKIMGQARVSFINNKNEFNQLVWPQNTLPYDLEGLARLPDSENQFIMMESTGTCYRVLIDSVHFKITIINIFELPMLKEDMNLEGINVFKNDSYYKIAYGDRGSNIKESILFTADYNPSTDSISNIDTYTINLPRPEYHKRNIADLAIDNRSVLWTSATSDPGDNGPFETILYKLGEFNPAGKFSQYKKNKPSFSFSGQKVEAMVFYKSQLILMTDNENFGSTFYALDISPLK